MGVPGQGHNRALALLSKMFNLAEEWGLRPAGRNPVSGLPRHPEKGRHWVATAEDYLRLWRALEEAKAQGKVLPTLPLAVKLLMLLGCNKKEAISLRWSQVRLQERYVCFDGANGRPRMVALPQAAIHALQAAPRQEGNPYVCWGKKPGSHLVGVNRFFKQLVREAGLERGLRIQDLRHLYPACSHWLSLI